MNYRDPSASHSISPSNMLSFNPSKGPYLIHLVPHSDMTYHIFSSLPKSLSAAHSDMPSQLYSSLPKNYSSIQVKSPTLFH